MREAGRRMEPQAVAFHLGCTVESPGSFVKITHAQGPPMTSESLGVGARASVFFKKLPRWFQCTVRAENSCG